MNKLVVKKKLKVITSFSYKVISNAWVSLISVAIAGFVLGAKIF